MWLTPRIGGDDGTDVSRGSSARPRSTSAETNLSRRFPACRSAAQFESALSKPDADPAKMNSNLQWLARYRCDQADSLICAAQFKQADAVVEPLTRDARLAKSPYAKLAAYYFGSANFELHDPI